MRNLILSITCTFIFVGCVSEQSASYKSRRVMQVAMLHSTVYKTEIGETITHENMYEVARPDFENVTSIGYRCYDPTGELIGSIEFNKSDKQWLMTPVEELGYGKKNIAPPSVDEFNKSGLDPARFHVDEKRAEDWTIVLPCQPFEVSDHNGNQIDGELVYSFANKEWFLMPKGYCAERAQEQEVLVKEQEVLEAQRKQEVLKGDIELRQQGIEQLAEEATARILVEKERLEKQEKDLAELTELLKKENKE